MYNIAASYTIKRQTNKQLQLLQDNAKFFSYCNTIDNDSGHASLILF